MNTLQDRLLERCWAAEGTHFYAQIKDTNNGKRVTHFHDEAEIEPGHNTYFAVATYLTPEAGRVQANVKSLPGWWMDFDTKNDGYETKQDIIQNLSRFVDAAKLPLPTFLVDSGNGIHVYWLATAPVEPTLWKTKAQALLFLAKMHNLKLDPVRTTDSASLMRLPGSVNHNSLDNAICTVMGEGDPVDAASFCGTVAQASDDSSFGVPTVNDVPGDADKIAVRCATMRHVQEKAGDVAEPLWYAALQVLAHCDDADAKAQQWSSGHPSYSPEETSAKLDRARDFGPTLCSRFQVLSPDTCAGCVFAEQISTPLQLGRKLEEVEDEPDEMMSPVLRQHYTVSEKGVWTKDDNAAQVCWVPLYVESVNDTPNGDAVAILLWRTPVGTWRRGELPLSKLADTKKLREWMYNHSITNFSEKHMVRYIKDFVTDALNRADPSPICVQFGWADDAFFIGDRMITEDETEKVRVSERVPRTILRDLKPHGKPDPWSHASYILSKPEYWKHAAAVLTSLSSPIYHLVGVQGAVLSLAGESGVGKTITSRFAMSAWGSPDALQVSPQGTITSKGEIFRLACHLPVLIDDITLAQSKQISELVYMAANGRAKERVTQSGQLRELEGWQLALITTTNSALMDLPDKYLGDAERRRIVELYVTDSIDPEEAAALNEAANTHGGAIAEHYLRGIMEVKDELPQMFASAKAELLAKHNIPDVQRFGIWMCAASLIAGKIARRQGVISFDPVPVVDQVAQSLAHQAVTQLAPVAKIDDYIQQYLNENSGRFTVKQPGRFIFDDVRGAIAGSILIHKRSIAIPAHKLKEFLLAQRVSSGALTQWATDNNVDRGTELLSRNGGREWCYKVPMTAEQVELIEAQFGGE